MGEMFFKSIQKQVQIMSAIIVSGAKTRHLLLISCYYYCQ